MNRDFLLCASVGVIGAALIVKGRRPLAKLQGAIIYARAAGFLAAEMVEGAKLRMARWPECLSKAERER